MRNHEYRNGQLIQTNKRFADLKQKQKEWINNQLKEKYIANYKEIGKETNKTDERKNINRSI